MSANNNDDDDDGVRAEEEHNDAELQPGQARRVLHIATKGALLNTHEKLTALCSLQRCHSRVQVYRRESNDANQYYEIYHVLDEWFVRTMLFIQCGSTVTAAECRVEQWRSGSSPFCHFVEPFVEQLSGTTASSGGDKIENEREERVANMLRECLLVYFECQVKHTRESCVGLGKSPWSASRLCDFANYYGATIGVDNAMQVCMDYQLEPAISVLLRFIDRPTADTMQAVFARSVTDAQSMLKRVRIPTLCAEYVPMLLKSVVGEHHETSEDETDELVQLLHTLVDLYPLVQPWFVRTHAPSTSVFRDYLLCLLRKHRSCRRDTTSVHEWIEMALADNPPERHLLYRERDVVRDFHASSDEWSWEVEGDSVVPAVDAHMVVWTHDDDLQLILGNPHEYTYDAHQVCAMLARYGYFTGMQQLYYHNHDAVECAIELATLTRDMHAVERILTRHDHRDTQINHSVQHWSHVFRCASLVANDQLTECLRMMVRLLGASRSIRILEHVAHMDTIDSSLLLNLDVVHTVLRQANLDTQRAMLRHDMLEMIDAHMWTQTTSALAITEPFRSLMALEEDIAVGEATDDHNRMLCATQNALKGYIHSTWSRRYEDLAMCTHWGLRIENHDNIVCSGCDMKCIALADCVAFECGHIFHAVCVHDEVCVKCLRMPSLCDL